ncbi:lysophospholipid acyltransferase family protein [Thermodesulfobacteriota bacterium B35]
MLKTLFFLLLVRPLVLLVCGINVRGRRYLPDRGPCIIAANHNSHLDTLVLMSLFPVTKVCRVRPVAAADYFLKNRLLAWFALELIGIIPISRRPTRKDGHPLAMVHEALQQEQIVIIFPEGSRGEPERLAPFKKGVAHLVRTLPEVDVVPVYLHGAGRSLPRGEALLVPFIIDVRIGPPLRYAGQGHARFVAELHDAICRLEQSIRGGTTDDQGTGHDI